MEEQKHLLSFLMEEQKPKLEVPVNQGDGDIKKKPSRKRYDIPKTVQCHICGDLAAEHLHYGGIACYSCRAFFRRTVNSSRPMLDCANDNNCNITKETRKRCQSCRFEKCKGVGMKPSWVLSENDRSKLALRKVESPSEDQNIESSIKQEPPAHLAQALAMLNDGSFIKKRHPSSPVPSPVSPPIMFKSSLLSPSYAPMQSPHSPNPYSSSPDPLSPPPYFKVPFVSNHTQPNNQIQNDRDFPHRSHSNNMKNEARNESKIEQKPDMFNKMQVSFMGPSDGLSFTIEAHREALSTKTESVQSHHNASHKNQFNMDDKFNWRQEGFHPNMSTNNNMRYDNGHSDGLSRVHMDGGFGSPNSEGSVKMNPRQHENSFSESDYRGQAGSNFSLQLENNISPDTMVFMGGQGGPNQQNQRHVQRQPDNQGFGHLDGGQPKKFKSHHQHTRTIFRCISPGSASSENGENEEKEIPHPEELAYRTEPCGQAQAPRIWKLSEPPPISPTIGTKSQFLLTLEEEVFVAQLNAIEDRVRCQVPMDVDHGRAFLECALMSNPVSQSTIMHAYQTCIKRIVRFANSLQDFVELPADDMQKLLVRNTVSIINIRIARWLHPKTSLKTQMALFWTGVDLFNEASECFDKGQVESQRVNSWEVFVSPWCCDSAYEDRYHNLLQLIYNLVIDNTTVVLLSVMCLFDSDASTGVHTTGVIKSHARKFSLLLQRYLIEKIGKEDAIATFPKFTLALTQLKEMADILVNRRLLTC